MNGRIELDWDKVDGLMPAVVQHAGSGRVLMLGYMNDEALDRTRATGRVTFFSRTKQRLWTKGETSGHFLELVRLRADCDGDALLVEAVPRGPVCHRGTDTCFGDDYAPPVGFLDRLERVIGARRGDDPESSYTARLLESGIQRCAQKVGEEGVEVALAAVAGNRDELVDEAADLLYHLLVVLGAAEVSLESVLEELQRRHARG
jgi:phosphoribosyl-ATP pyrophosphohydrolase/phosphoribosyl-AMP cyclohydrolase